MSQNGLVHSSVYCLCQFSADCVWSERVCSECEVNDYFYS